MRHALLFAAALSIVPAQVFGRGLPPVATVQSSTIPPAVLQGGTVTCTFSGPNGTREALPINNLCWDGYVYQGGVYTIKAQNFTTGVEASGAAQVPGSECTPGTPPRCTIELSAPVFPQVDTSDRAGDVR